MSSSERDILMHIAVVPTEREVSESIEALVHEQARMVFKIAYSVLRHRADAEDVTQEVFLRVLRHAKELDQVRNQKAWLAKIAWRTAVDWAKRREHPHEDVDAVAIEQSNGIDVNASLIDQQQLELLRQLISTLPRDLREPLVLSTVEEMSSSDIAEVLSIPEASVRTRMARARTILKQKLEALSRRNSR